MSVLGTLQTSMPTLSMSALGGEADMAIRALMSANDQLEL